MEYLLTLGGWYQRTTLHLSEIYGLFSKGHSSVPGLSAEKMTDFHNLLDLESVTRESGNFEYVLAKTRSGITIKYFEDGLYTLQLKSDDINAGRSRLDYYLNHSFSPAISYIFSQGAPTPKVLANIKTIHPTVVSPITDHPDMEMLKSNINTEVYGQISSDKYTVYKTPEYIFILTTSSDPAALENIIEMQIFFREFKDQLEKYLQIHRHIWEEISAIKELPTVKGNQIRELRLRLDSYQKTVNLITSRINQMGAYINTRSSLSRQLAIEDHLKTLFQYKFETLTDTLAYIKEIWSMTREYLASAVQVLVELDNQSTNNTIRSLQILTSVGVVSGVLTYLTRNEWPQISQTGLAYFLLLITFTYLLNISIGAIYKNLRYKIKFIDHTSDL
jgi:hypothetical protein